MVKKENILDAEGDLRWVDVYLKLRNRTIEDGKRIDFDDIAAVKILHEYKHRRAKEDRDTDNIDDKSVKSLLLFLQKDRKKREFHSLDEFQNICDGYLQALECRVPMYLLFIKGPKYWTVLGIHPIGNCKEKELLRVYDPFYGIYFLKKERFMKDFVKIMELTKAKQVALLPYDEDQ